MTASPTYGKLTDQGASTNIAWHHASVDRAARAEQRGHRSAILWFTGLSGAGKSTLANAVNQALFERGLATYVLDGDNIRHGLCKDLGFSDADREETSITPILETPFFNLDRLIVTEEMTLENDGTSFEVLFAVDGDVVLEAGGETLTVERGASALIPAGLPETDLIPLTSGTDCLRLCGARRCGSSKMASLPPSRSMTS